MVNDGILVSNQRRDLLGSKRRAGDDLVRASCLREAASLNMSAGRRESSQAWGEHDEVLPPKQQAADMRELVVLERRGQGNGERCKVDDGCTLSSY